MSLRAGGVGNNSVHCIPLVHYISCKLDVRAIDFDRFKLSVFG